MCAAMSGCWAVKTDCETLSNIGVQCESAIDFTKKAEFGDPFFLSMNDKIIEDFVFSNGKRFLFQNFRLEDAAFFSELNKN